MSCFLPEVLECIFSFLAPSKSDLHNITLVCESWYRIERSCRTNLVIPNCFALSPERLVGRFTRLKTLTLKGRPQENDPQLRKSGALAYPWIEALTRTCPGLEEIKLKRMVVDDDSLVLIAHHFKKLKSLVLVQCDGFSTFGLAAIASHCRLLLIASLDETKVYKLYSFRMVLSFGKIAETLLCQFHIYSFLEVLDLQENEIMEGTHNWLRCFPENFNSLECLNFASLEGEIDLEALERLVACCPKLRSLRLSKAVPFDILRKILVQAPQLFDLGVGSYVQTPNSESQQNMHNAVFNCPSIRRLSGFLEAQPLCLPAMYPICSNLTFLDLRKARILSPYLTKMLRECQNLQQLWVSDAAGISVPQLVATNCKDLREFKVVLSDPSRFRSLCRGSRGFEIVSMGCPKLKYLAYTCEGLRNSSLILVAKNCPDLTHFELHARKPTAPDLETSKPFDEGVRAIVSSCKKLKHLCLSICLSDQVFLDIGVYAKQLEMLSISYCGESDNGILFALSGCEKLKRLVVRNSPFCDATLLAAARWYEALQSFSVCSCEISLGACKALARAYPMLNVEITDEEGQMVEHGDDQKIERIYIYRSLDGARADRPWFIYTL